jgi:poly-D-alanine transfer protein DltD
MEQFKNRIAELLQVWHPIEGKWYCFAQTDKDGIRTYYTDGVEVHKAKINKDGYVERDSMSLDGWVEDSRTKKIATYEKKYTETNDSDFFFVSERSRTDHITPPKLPPEGTIIELIRESHQTKGIRFRIEYDE